MPQQASAPAPDAGAGLTRELARRALQIRFEDLPPDVRRVARDCLLDWLAVTLAATREPVVGIVLEAVREEGGLPQASLIGLPGLASVAQAALLNGTTSHALDYDDVNLVVPGHSSAAIMPALLALAEHRKASGRDFIAAFVAGFETMARIGALVEPSHYAIGFHATATLGSFGAAMACAHLLKLPLDAACHALGLAGTQAAGLKAMFGTMAKPLHAGMAAQTGVRAALLAAKGFVSRMDVLECPKGFARLHGQDFHPDRALAEPPLGHYLLGNLFKFHAACYSAHSTIEAVNSLRLAHGLRADAVARIEVSAGEGCSICNIAEPANDLEAKFSLRACAAFAILDLSTSDLQTWARVTEPAVVALRDRVQVTLLPNDSLSAAEVRIVLNDGRSYTQAHDSGTPLSDKADQGRRLRAKFEALAAPSIGAARSAAILGWLDALEDQGGMQSLTALCRAD